MSFRFLLPTPVPFVFVVLLILNPLALAWGNPVQTTSNESLLPTEEAFPITAIPQKPHASVLKQIARQERSFGRLIDKTAKGAANKHLVRGLVHVESKGNPKALNPDTEAAGLMQIIPDTKEYMQCGSIEAPERNLRCGVKYLKYLCDKRGFCEEHELALAYRLGPTGATRAKERDPDILFTHPYVQTVLWVASLSRQK